MSSPTWGWWARPETEVRLRHAVAILRRGAALERVILEGGPPLDRALQDYQRAHPALGSHDRLLLGTAVYHLARNRQPLRLAMPEAVPGAGDLLVLALLDAQAVRPQAMPGLKSPPDWGWALENLKENRERWADLLASSRAPSPGDLTREERQAFLNLFSVPDTWLDLGPWQSLEAALAELGRLKVPQYLCLRAQTHRTTREAVLEALSRLGIPARPTHRSPWGVVVEGRHNVLGTDLYRSGAVEVQDEGSQLVASLCDPKPDERVLDLCAGAGGKSLALGSMLRGRGSIVAHDRDRERLRRTRERARRAGLGNIRTVPDPKEVERLGPYHLVLVDAPCSSTGTLRRNPDVAWRYGADGIARLKDLQAAVLDRAASLLRADGFLVYVTCSLLEPENGRQIELFLSRNPEFRPRPPGDRRGQEPVLDVPGASTGVFRIPATLPHYDGDAFFFARLRREG